MICRRPSGAVNISGECVMNYAPFHTKKLVSYEVERLPKIIIIHFLTKTCSITTEIFPAAADDMLMALARSQK